MLDKVMATLRHRVMTVSRGLRHIGVIDKNNWIRNAVCGGPRQRSMAEHVRRRTHVTIHDCVYYW